jgi:hypothetical protein
MGSSSSSSRRSPSALVLTMGHAADSLQPAGAAAQKPFLAGFSHASRSPPSSVKCLQALWRAPRPLRRYSAPHPRLAAGRSLPFSSIRLPSRSAVPIAIWASVTRFGTPEAAQPTVPNSGVPAVAKTPSNTPPARPKLNAPTEPLGGREDGLDIARPRALATSSPPPGPAPTVIARGAAAIGLKKLWVPQSSRACGVSFLSAPIARLALRARDRDYEKHPE